MQVLNGKIEVEAMSVSSTHSPLINPIFSRGENQMTSKNISKSCIVAGCDSRRFGHGLCNKHYKRQRKYGSVEKRSRLTCVVPDCAKLRFGHGYCQTHYTRFQRNGSPDLLPSKCQLKDPSIFWLKVAITADDQRCWEWQGLRDKDGYGVAYAERRNIRGHRLAYRLTHGRMPNGLVRHTCDNPPCVNPNHLLEGTPQDNSNDRVERGRSPCGENHANAVLTEAQVREIKARVVHYPKGPGKGQTDSQAALAKEFGVSRRVIYLIMLDRLWRHVR